MRVKIRCSNCEQLLMVREEEVGTQGRCPMCKQQIILSPPPKAPKREPAAAQPATPQVQVAAAGLAAGGAPMIALSPPDGPGQGMSLAVETLEEDVARRQMEVRGSLTGGSTGPGPAGKPRNLGLVFLLSLVPIYPIYWFIVVRGEILAHRKQPASSAVHILIQVLLVLVTGGIFGGIYCFYIIPKRIVAIQSACGDPRRISPPTCLVLGLIPALGWALCVLMMQKSLTFHWQWHEQRVSESVTAGLAC